MKQKKVDLGAKIRSFEITLELNGLLLRNSKLMPSELVRKNLIFVARTKTLPTQQCGSVSQFPEVWRSILSQRNAPEMFVVSFCLSIADFTVNLANTRDISLSFYEDSNFDALQSCDSHLSHFIEDYVRKTLISELKKLDDFSIHITSPATILQNLPPIETISGLEDVYSSCSVVDPDQLVDASLTDIDISSRREKQLIFADDQDFDPSDDELRILPSDDSAKGTAHEDDDLDRLFSNDSLPRMKLEAILDLDIQEDASTMLEFLSTEPADKFTSKNPTPETLGPGFDDQPQTRRKPDSTGHDNNSENDKIEVPQDFISSPIKPLRPVFGSVDIVHNPLPKKPSLSFIDHDEEHGLEYAFRNRSPEIPKFIKDDKKFKFIKIGKVQKFVNMFEERRDTDQSEARPGRTNSRANSRVNSRVGTRPASPLN